ncbi:MIP/aquaporin family protein [Populibacterium corticicola]|uniref:MIP/aquaporin family protein n=1 Tax=Populibacterium corticicola TaxID=1812826 RepID=A0ABW5XFS4_9MICO
MHDLTPWQVFFSEFLGTTVLLAIGTSVGANGTLRHTKGFNAGWVGTVFGWGFAVFTAAHVAYKTGAHLNPAVTLGLALHGSEFAPGIPVNVSNATLYLSGQLLGAFVGCWVTYLAYQPHFALVSREKSLGIFATTPQIRRPWWNLVTEIIATTVLVLWLLVANYTTSGLGPLAVAVVIIAIGLGFGGPTGFAINPARDLGARLAHAVLPLKNKGSSEWDYAWIPIVGPFCGAAFGALLASML